MTFAVSRPPEAAEARVVVGSSLPQIPALTGLRFWAAFFILFAHAADWLFQFQTTNVRQQIAVVAIYGMPLFFVLSGFVIYYNYHKTFLWRSPLRATCEFAVARAARLLPLYFAFLFMAIFADQLMAKTKADGALAAEILAYDATLTQSWWYIVIDQREIINWLFPLSWSISTEMFFYVAFVPAVFAVLAIKTPRQSSVMAVVFAVALTSAFIVANRHLTAILSVAQAQVPGYIAIDNFTESFYRWAFYFSPYARMFEFFMGVLTAHAFISWIDWPVSRIEKRVADAALIGALLALVLFGLCTTNIVQFGILNTIVAQLARNFLCAPAIAIILFYVARYDAPFTRAMSLAPLVALGERSYSIYLVHTWTLRIFAFPPAPELNWVSGAEAALRMFCAIVLTLLVADATYRLIEVPSRAWLRRKFNHAFVRWFRKDDALTRKRVDSSPSTRGRLAFAVAAVVVLVAIVIGGQALRGV